MTKVYDVIMNCFMSAAVLFSFHYVVISLVVYCTDEPMTAETRIQLIKSTTLLLCF